MRSQRRAACTSAQPPPPPTAASLPAAAEQGPALLPRGCMSATRAGSAVGATQPPPPAQQQQPQERRQQPSNEQREQQRERQHPLHDLDQELPVLDPVGDYEKIKRIGEGTFGIVCERRAGRRGSTRRRRRRRRRAHCSHCSHGPTKGRAGYPCASAADMARDKRTGELVALKKLRMERERDGGWMGVCVRCGSGSAVPCGSAADPSPCGPPRPAPQACR